MRLLLPQCGAAGWEEQEPRAAGHARPLANQTTHPENASALGALGQRLPPLASHAHTH